jgi:hypothetical protein
MDAAALRGVWCRRSANVVMWWMEKPPQHGSQWLTGTDWAVVVVAW